MPQPGSGTPADVQAEINPDGFTSARECGECHEDIYTSWKGSLHALSLQDPIFDAAYMQALKLGGEEARQRCLHCHAPMTMTNGDYSLEKGVTRDGVSCDFCHSVTAVHLDGREKPYVTEPGMVKRGIIKKAASPVHETAYSELHGRSEFCGGCHNYVTPEGAAVLSTYDEWRDGPFARKGIQCQDCHMVLSEGNVVRPDVKSSRSQIHLHKLIHDSDQIRRALSVRIADSQRSGERLVVDVEVENRGSGHMVPTGIPTRRVVLEISLEADAFRRKQERIYQKVVADASGHLLEKDFEVMTLGARILNDNRIAPGETRRERFTFRVPPRGRIRISAALLYQYPASIVRDHKLQIALGETEQIVY